MSDVARQARGIADSLLPRERRLELPPAADVEAAMAELRTLTPADAHDEMAIGEAGEILLRLRDAAEEE